MPSEGMNLPEPMPLYRTADVGWRAVLLMSGGWCRMLVLSPKCLGVFRGVEQKTASEGAVISAVFFGPLFQTLKCVSFDPFCQSDRVESSAGLGVVGLFRRAEKSGFDRCVGCRGFRSMLTFGKSCQLRMDAVARRKDRFARIFLSRSVGFRDQFDCGASVFLGQPSHIADESGFIRSLFSTLRILSGNDATV